MSTYLVLNHVLNALHIFYCLIHILTHAIDVVDCAKKVQSTLPVSSLLYNVTFQLCGCVLGCTINILTF